MCTRGLSAAATAMEADMDRGSAELTCAGTSSSATADGGSCNAAARASSASAACRATRSRARLAVDCAARRRRLGARMSAMGDVGAAGGGKDKDHDAAWFSKWLMKEEKVEGRKHKKKFKGSPEELKTMSEWLTTLKFDAPKKKDGGGKKEKASSDE